MTTYANLVSNIKQYMEDDGTEFSTAIDTFIDLTEIKNQGYLDVKEVKKILNDKNSDGYFRNNYLVWDLLIFQSWYNFNK